MNIRKALFDLTKKDILKHLEEVKSLNESSNFREVEAYQQKKLNELLSYCKENIPFYKKIKGTQLSDFPVLNKALIKEKLEDHLNPDIQEFTSLVTSGSTGTPFKVYQDINKQHRNSADTMYFAKKAGFEIGTRLAYLKIWSAANHKSWLQKTAQNIRCIDVMNFNDKEVEKFLSDSKKGENILGYASALEKICKHLDTKEGNTSYDFNSIISMSETLEDATKERLKKYFNCTPCARYSNIEQGIIAQETLENNKEFKINIASYRIEILKMNSNEPAEEGEVGRIVLTDLFNKKMPFIRYDTGDLGIVRKKGNISTHLLKVLGRKLDTIYNTKGEIISSYIVYKNMFKYTEIDQYQLIQVDEMNYRFKISCKDKFKREEELIKEFKEHLGQDAIFECEYVNEIPLLSSGKRKKVINLMNI